MKKRFTSRGYSILAALVFVAILGTITVAVNFISTSANPIAMSAAVSPTNPTGGAQIGTGQEMGKQNQCQPGFDYKIRRGLQQDLPQIEAVQVCPPPGQSQSAPEDIKPTGPSTPGVSLPAAAIFALETGGTGTFGQRNDPARCEVVPKSNPQQWKPKQAYKCKVRYCTPAKGANEVCIDVANLFSPNSTFDLKSMEGQLRGPLIASVMQNTPPSEQAQVLRDMGVTASEQAGLNAAFSEQRQQLGTQVQQNESKIDQLRQYIDSCSDCAGGELTKAQGDLAKLEAENSNLKKRMDSLASAEKANLTPPAQLPPVAPRLPPSDPRKESTFPDPSPSGGGGNPMSAIGSLLQGLLKGLGGSGAGQGAACASDPTAYQQQQQQYQMQMQQYNYQLQQYNYQQQQASYYGGTPPTPPTPPVACTPTSSTNTCPAAPVQPTTGCSGGTWQPVKTTMSNGYQCTSNWQCTPTNAVTPTADLSCQPKIADIGMSIAITFACTNATGSTGSGSGFSTDNKTSGTSTPVIATPPAGATGITYTLTCRNQNLTARAECSVQIAKPTIVLLANPKNVASGQMSNVGWVTSGMQSCVVSSPQMPGFTTQNADKKDVNGVATTSPLTRDTTVVLTCQTIGGNTKAASTTILVGNSTSTTAMSVSSTIDGRTDVKHGATTTITWAAPSAPSNSAIALWLVDMLSGQATGLIHRTTSASGTYAWALPATSSPCAVDSPAVCGADLVVGRSYSIQASLFTPPDAYIGGYPPANPITPTYLDDVSTIAFKISN